MTQGFFKPKLFSPVMAQHLDRVGVILKNGQKSKCLHPISNSLCHCLKNHTTVTV